MGRRESRAHGTDKLDSSRRDAIKCDCLGLGWLLDRKRFNKRSFLSGCQPELAHSEEVPELAFDRVST